MFDSISPALDEDEINNFKKNTKVEEEKKTITEKSEEKKIEKKIISTKDEIEIITNQSNLIPLSNCFYFYKPLFFLDIPATELTYILEEQKPMSRFEHQNSTTTTKDYSNYFSKKYELKDMPKSPTCLEKIFLNLKEKKEKRNTILSKTFCIILYFEEFSPIKKKDLLILEKVKESLENENYQVCGGFLIPIPNESNNLKKRIEMCKIITNDSSWIETDEYYSTLNDSKSQFEVIVNLQNLIGKYFKNEFENLKLMNINFSDEIKLNDTLNDIESVFIHKEKIEKIYGNHYLEHSEEFENEEIDSRVEEFLKN